MTNQDHWEIKEKIEVDHWHSYVHEHPIEGVQRKYEAAAIAHWHKPDEPHRHEMLVRPTDNGYEIIHPPMDWDGESA